MGGAAGFEFMAEDAFPLDQLCSKEEIKNFICEEVSKQRIPEVNTKPFRSVKGDARSAFKRVPKEKDIDESINAVDASECVDLAFIIDGTASMRKHIAAVKQSIRHVVDQILLTNPNLRLRLAIVVYRDLEFVKRFEVLDFTSSIDEFECFVDAIVAGGNRRKARRDGPEDMAGGIWKANQITWYNPTRVAFLIADHPCHGKEFHDDGVWDNFPNGTPGINIIKELKTLVSRKGNGTMTVNFGRITSHTDYMLRRFKEADIFLEDIDLRYAEKMVASVTNGVRKSIFRTMAATGGRMKSVSVAPVFSTDPWTRSGESDTAAAVSPMNSGIVPRPPSMEEWKKHGVVSTKVFRNRPIKYFDDLQAPISFGLVRFRHPVTNEASESTVYLRQAAYPFAEGTNRIAYHAQLARNKEELEEEKSGMVIKTFRHRDKGLNDRQQYLKQMEVSNIVHFLATEYNQSSYRPSHCAFICVLQVCVLEEQDETNEFNGIRRFFAERLLPQDGTAFTQYSNNTGYWNVDELEETLLRFTEFTFMATNKYLMVTNLQGVQKGNEFFLTNPSILCRDVLRFGHTNLGEKFMSKCIDSTRALMVENGWH